MWCVTKPKDVCLGGFSNWTWRKRCSVLIKEKTTNGTSSICQYLNSFSQDYNYGGKIRSCPKLNTPRGKLISASDNILIRTDFFYFLTRKPRTRGSRGTSKNMVMRFMISLTGVWISCLMRKSENKVGITLDTWHACNHYSDRTYFLPLFLSRREGGRDGGKKEGRKGGWVGSLSQLLSKDKKNQI